MQRKTARGPLPGCNNQQLHDVDVHAPTHTPVYTQRRFFFFLGGERERETNNGRTVLSSWQKEQSARR